MIRTIVKAETKNINLEIPDEYLGKDIEILVFLLNEGNSISANEPVITHFATQKILSKDWDTPEEDEAWQSL